MIQAAGHRDSRQFDCCRLAQLRSIADTVLSTKSVSWPGLGFCLFSFFFGLQMLHLHVFSPVWLVWEAGVCLK